MKRTPHVTDRELVAALVELADAVRELRAEVAALRAELPQRIVERLDEQGLAVAAPEAP